MNILILSGKQRITLLANEALALAALSALISKTMEQADHQDKSAVGVQDGRGDLSYGVIGPSIGPHYDALVSAHKSLTDQVKQIGRILEQAKEG